MSCNPSSLVNSISASVCSFAFLFSNFLFSFFFFLLHTIQKNTQAERGDWWLDLIVVLRGVCVCVCQKPGTCLRSCTLVHHYPTADCLFFLRLSFHYLLHCFHLCPFALKTCSILHLYWIARKHRNNVKRLQKIQNAKEREREGECPFDQGPE